jgi:tetrahydromethanopterin S-methyltransferase subunit B
MVKLFNIIKKNLKVLARSKSSALVVLLGPLLIVTLIALAFNNVGSDYELNIGVYIPEESDSTQTFLMGLQDEYLVVDFPTNDSCINSIKTSESHICLIFPENLILDDEYRDEILIYVDQSRMNLVDAVINRISELIGIGVESTSKDLTSSLITSIGLTRDEVEENLHNAVGLKQKTSNLATDIGYAQSNLNYMNLDMVPVNTNDVSVKALEMSTHADDLKEDALKAINESLDFIESISNSSGSPASTLRGLEDDIISDAKSVNSSYADLLYKLKAVDATLESIETKFSNAKSKRTAILTELDDVVYSIDDINYEISSLKYSLETVMDSISAIKVLDADSIINPITTTIMPVHASKQKSLFLFPDLLILVIMLIGVMLSGTSIIIDKLSPASFRTFASPTRDSVYLVAYYITNLLIIFVQTIIIAGLAAYFLKIDILSNLGLSMLIVFLAASLFILFGTLFGYVFKSQEGVTIAALSFSSVLLFVSNLIIPLESAPSIVQKIARFNPFVVLSDALKKSMLFQLPIQDFYYELIVVLCYIVIVYMLIFLVQKLSKIIYFRRIPHLKLKKIDNLTQEHYFRLIDGNVLKNEGDLLKFLRTCDHDEFKEFVDHENNKFVIWLKKILKKKRLAKKLDGVTTKDEMIRIIEEDIAKYSSNSK